jgi:hypothetical protein
LWLNLFEVKLMGKLINYCLELVILDRMWDDY